MNFYTESELRTETKAIWKDLANNTDVVITNKGKPCALMVGIPEGQFDETVRSLRQAKAFMALERMRKKSKKRGFMSDEEIEEAIREAREE